MSDSDSEYDADLKRAIALSLRDQSQPKSSPASKPIPEVIDLLSSSDEEIEDFDAPPVRKRKVLPPSASKAAAKSPAKPDIKSEEPDIEIMKEVRSSKPISQTSRGVQKSNLPASANLSGNSNNSTTSSVADATQSSTETLEDDQPAKDFVAENSTTPDPVVSPLFHPKSDEAPHTSLVDGRFPSPCSEVPHALKPALNSSSTITDVNQPQKLDRKKMEEERLMRLKQRKLKEEGLGGLDANDSRKRKSSQSPIQSPSSAARQSKKVMTLDRSPGEGIRPGDNVTPSSGQYLDHPCSKPQDQGASAIQYPNGVVKKTWVYGQPRDNDVKIEEVLQKDTLQLAVLSAFQVEPEWVVRKLGPATRVVWVLQAKTDDEKANMKSEAPDNFKFCFPPMSEQGCMHSKLMLLSHKTHLRIVIPSANLVPYDWGETGVMENMCFIIDLPRLPNGQLAEMKELPEFGKELLHFLDAKGLNGEGLNLVSSIMKFDFSNTSKLAFVHSIGGSHSGEAWKTTGVCGLGTAVQNLGFGSEDPMSINFVTASIGALTDGFIKSIYLAAQGDNGVRALESRAKNSKSTKEIEAKDDKLSKDVNNGFRIYFPTHETVANSKGGAGCGGTICFQERWFDAATFPEALLRDCKSTRPGILMHNKLLFCRPSSSSSSSAAPGDTAAGSEGWAYVGSANLSEAAWGRLVKDRTTKEPKLNIRNWECGVVVPAEMVPVPMQVPGEEYGARKPWFFMGGNQ